MCPWELVGGVEQWQLEPRQRPEQHLVEGEGRLLSYALQGNVSYQACIFYRGKTQGLMTSHKHKALAWQASPSFWQEQIPDRAETYAVCKADALLINAGCWSGLANLYAPCRHT